jgi:hypothetical protein
MDWSSFISSMLGAMVAVSGFAFWLGGLARSVKSIRESMIEAVNAIRQTCEERKGDHCHHYQAISDHNVQIGRLDTRVMSLEAWRQKADG